MQIVTKFQSFEAFRLWDASRGTARLLNVVREYEPLTIPEVLAALPDELKATGTWRLIIAERPQIVVWDSLLEVTAAMLTQLLSTQQLSLQICRPQLYDISGVKLALPAVESVLHAARNECWLPCTVGAGPTQGLNSDWKIAFRSRVPAN
ncbi:MAG TPA: hypothetical protein VHB77_11740 [Planctomycetaceae bacterium]|nr:hypothetical protein [Planctomycetaceae bacterium]